MHGDAGNVAGRCPPYNDLPDDRAGGSSLTIDFAVIADYALFDQQGKLSVLGIFRHVVVAAFPAMHPRTHLVLRVRGRRTEVGTHVLRIRFLDQDGHQLAGGEGTVQFGEPPAGVTDVEAAAVLVFDVPLPRPGQYHFEVSVGQDEPVRVPLSAGPAASPTGLM